MKLNLAVVMQTIDKSSAVVKKMNGSYGQFTPKIEAAQKALKNNSGALSNIQTLKKLQQQHRQNGLAVKAAAEKVAILNAKIKASKQPSQAMLLQMQKQEQKLADLKQNQGSYTAALSKTGGALKKAGVNTKNLTSEEQRLTAAHSKSISKLASLQKRYKKIEGIKAKLSRPFTMGGIKAGAIGVVGLTATIGGLFVKINNTAGVMDKLSKTAQNLKMPIGELQAMQSQAEHSGVGADNMATSLMRFTKRLGVLQTTGTGALGSFLKKGKNPLFKELQTAKTTGDAYEKLLANFSKLKTNQEQMAFADAAFGQDGRKMLIMLREGTDGLTSSRKEFNDLGGGVKEKDAKAAEAYNDALQKVQEAMKSIQFAALAPLMRELTSLFTEFSNKFKNADWREAAIAKVTKGLKNFFDIIKAIGRAFVFLKNYFPEVVAGLLLLKTAFFALNAVVYANPIGLLVAGLAAVAIGLTYAYTKSETFRAVMDRLGAGITGMFGAILGVILLIPRAIMKMVSMIPDSLLPDGWGASIKQTQKDLEGLNTSLDKSTNKSIKFALNGDPAIKQASKLVKGSIGLDLAAEATQNQIVKSTSIIKSPAIQSKSTVELRIKSDKPVDIAKVDTDNGTNLKIDSGDLLGSGI